MPEVDLSEVTREAKEEAEAEKRKKKLRLETTERPAERYDAGAVKSIVQRMHQKYEERGFVEREGEGKADLLKDMVVGSRGLALDQRSPQELVMVKSPFPRMVGQLFLRLRFLDFFANEVSRMSLSKNLIYDLNSANMNYSAKQFSAIAFVSSVIAAFFGFFLCGALVFTVFSAYLLPLVAPFTGGEELLDYVFLGAVSLFLSFFVFMAAVFVSVSWPRNVAGQRAKAIDKTLPFALRHMSTEVRAGVGIHKTMQSIVDAGYGVLSGEFDRTMKDIDKGMSTEEALDAMALRSPSDNLSKATRHIIRALKTGGNLSDIIETIASDVAFELRMRMKDFVERLNIIGLFYMMVGIVFPVFVAIIAGIFNAIPTIGMQGILGAEVLFLVYFLMIPLALGLILYIIKVMQPM